jgi:hypothetical protein
VQVTLYDRPGVHIFMNIDGRFFGTSDGAGGGDPRGGAGWLDDGAPDAFSTSFKPYHVVASALRGSANTGHIVSFQRGTLQNLTVGLEVGETVQVDYRELASGSLGATSVAFPGAATVNGTVQTIATDGSSFTIQTADGLDLTFATADDPGLLQAVAVGDTVEVTYTTSAGAFDRSSSHDHRGIEPEHGLGAGRRWRRRRQREFRQLGLRIWTRRRILALRPRPPLSILRARPRVVRLAYVRVAAGEASCLRHPRSRPRRPPVRR